jgi:hypothetical protein
MGQGASEAPDLIRRELHSEAYSFWSETRIDLGAAGDSLIMATSSSPVTVIRVLAATSPT